MSFSVSQTYLESSVASKCCLLLFVFVPASVCGRAGSSVKQKRGGETTRTKLLLLLLFFLLDQFSLRLWPTLLSFCHLKGAAAFTFIYLQQEKFIENVCTFNFVFVFFYRNNSVVTLWFIHYKTCWNILNRGAVDLKMHSQIFSNSILIQKILWFILILWPVCHVSWLNFIFIFRQLSCTYFIFFYYFQKFSCVTFYLWGWKWLLCLSVECKHLKQYWIEI